MNNALLATLVIAVSGALLGCVPPITVVASHVTQTTADKSNDDIWIIHGHVLKRCHNTDKGPVCVPVRDL